MGSEKELISERDFAFITSKYGTLKGKRERIEKLLKDACGGLDEHGN